MAQKPYAYATLEAIALMMREYPDMVYIYEYAQPVATLPDGTILNVAREFGPVRTSGEKGGWALDEPWYVGCATGIAATGVRAVARLPSMTTTIALEYIFNQVGNFRMMTGGQAELPMVVWIDGAGRTRGSAQQHTQVGHEALYANLPGLKVVVPSDAYVAKGLLITAIRDPDPVIFCDYREVAAGEQPDVPDEAYEVPIGTALVRQEGTDLTLVSWAPATVDVKLALPEIEAAGISVEYIDLITIKPMDVDTVVNSVKKTGKLLVVEHGYWTNGFSANVVAEVVQALDGAKIRRITFPDAAGPSAAEMINWMRPDAPKIVDAVKKVAAL